MLAFTLGSFDLAPALREDLASSSTRAGGSPLSVPIQATYTLGQADQALKALTTQHTQAKLSITLPDLRGKAARRPGGDR